MLAFGSKSVMMCALTAGLLACVGCSGESGPQVFPVTGVVLRNGAPMPDANVEFLPEKGRPSAATTDDEGRFVLEYAQGTPGAVAGNHKVMVIEQFQGAGADGGTAAPAPIPAEPMSYQLTGPVQVNAESNAFKIDVTAGTVTPES